MDKLRLAALAPRLGASSFIGDRQGGIALITAITLAGLVASVGAAIEYSRLTQQKANLQNALDAAVLAGAIEGGDKPAAAAERVLRAGLTATGLEGVSAQWATLDDGTFTGAASGKSQLTFGKVLGIASVEVGAKAAAIGAATSPGCIHVLDPTVSQAMIFNNAVKIDAPRCRIDVASRGYEAAVFNRGQTLGLNKICVASSTVLVNGERPAVLETNCPALADPYAGKLPLVADNNCTQTARTFSGVQHLVPGVYCGAFGFNMTGTLTLSPGLYVFKNAQWVLGNGWTVTGKGVTFYFSDQNSYIQANGDVRLDISAPKGGAYSGLLVFEPNGLPISPYTISGGRGHLLEGLIYQPSRNIIFNDKANVTSANLSLVVNQLILDDVSWSIGAQNGASGAASASASRVRITH